MFARVRKSTGRSKQEFSANHLDTKARRESRVSQVLTKVAVGVAAAWLVWTWTQIFKLVRRGKETSSYRPHLDLGPDESSTQILLIPQLQSNLPGFDVLRSFGTYLEEPHLPEDGREGKAAEDFKLDFIELEEEKTGTRTSSSELTNAGGCAFRGPKLTSSQTPQQVEAIQESLLLNLDQQGLRDHLKTVPGAYLLSTEHHTLCSWDPTPFLPSLPAFSQVSEPTSTLRSTNEFSEDEVIGSAYVFHDVCVSWNIDSSKQAQRAVILFDPANKNAKRCALCPNPQTNIEWGSNPCGMMWFHQANAMSLKDYVTCYAQQRKLNKANGQRQIPGESSWKDMDTSIRAAVYYDRPTLLLQYTRNNPGHQLWDSLFSILTILKSQDVHNVNYYDLVAVHQTPFCEENIWICSILRRLGAITTQSGPRPVLEMFPGVLTCFSELIVPIQGWNHNNLFSSEALLSWLTAKLNEAYDLNKTPMSPYQVRQLLTSFGAGGNRNTEQQATSDRFNMLLYAHNTVGEAGKRRSWLNIQQSISDWKTQRPDLDLQYIPDFAAVAVEDQARAFHQADLVVMPHGGQFGNSIFLRENSIVIEMTCGGYSHMAILGKMAKALKIYHVVYKPCRCQGGSDESNFDFGPKELESLLQWGEERFFKQSHGTFRPTTPFCV